MKDDLNASEKRLIAALDRIDLLIDRAAAAGGGVEGDGAPQQAPPEASTDHDAALAACEARLAEAQDRLDAAGAEAARLAEANAALVEANAALLAGAPGAAEIRQAFEAELEALRAARAAEMGQVGDILGALNQWLGTAGESGAAPDTQTDALPEDPPSEAAPAPEPARPAMVETPMPIDTASGETGAPPADRISTSEDRD